MKKYLFLLLIIYGLTGCIGAIRKGAYDPVEGEGWSFHQDGNASFTCPDMTLSMKAIPASLLIIAGPFIPLIPVKHASYTGHVSLSMQVHYIGGFAQCPELRLGEHVIEAYYRRYNYTTHTYCTYDLKKLYGRQKKITLSVNTKGNPSCKVNDLQFMLNHSWSYAPLVQ